MSADELHYKSISELSELFRRKEALSSEVIQVILNRIDKLNGSLHGYAVILAEWAIAQARKHDSDNKIAAALTRSHQPTPRQMCERRAHRRARDMQTRQPVGLRRADGWSVQRHRVVSGYTYSAHPLACAAALATLDVYRDLELFTRGRRLAPIWEQVAHGLKDAPHVVDIRNIGLLAAIDLTPRDGAPGARGAECAKRCFDDGVLIRSSGDTLVLSPPLIIAENEIEMVFATIRRALGDDNDALGHAAATASRRISGHEYP